MNGSDDTVKEFDSAYRQFLSGKDPSAHREAVKTLLAHVERADEFDSLLDEDRGVENFFSLWERAGREEEDPTDRDGLRELGAQSKKRYEQNDLRGLCRLFEGMLLNHLAGYLRIKEREDFEEMTDHDLFEKNLLPSEIYLQYFLIGTLAKAYDFDWDRGEEINRQNLACFITCFGDIYDFINEEEDEEDGTTG